MMTTFVGYSEISILKPQTRYFQKKVKCRFFKKCVFWGYDLENWVWANLVLWVCPILWIRVKIGYTQLYLQYTPPRTGVFNPIRTDGTFERWPKKTATQISTRKKFLLRFSPKKSISPAKGENPCKDFCLEKWISPILGQSLEAPQHRAHIQ